MKDSKSVNKSLLATLGIYRPKFRDKKTTVMVDTSRTTSISGAEQKRLLNSTYVPQTESRTIVDDSSLLRALQPQVEDLFARKIEMSELKALVPKIGQAETILIHSILSPNDLQTGNLTFSVTCDNVSEETNTAVGNLIYDHMVNKLGIHTKLIGWLKEALFGVGAKPIMVLPETSLIDLVKREVLYNKKTKSGYSQEALTVDDLTTNDIFNPYVGALENLSVDFNEYCLDDTEIEAMAMESAIGYRSVKNNPKKTVMRFNSDGALKAPRASTQSRVESIKNIQTKLVSEMSKCFKTIKNPASLTIPKLSASLEASTVETKLNSFFGLNDSNVTNYVSFQEEPIVTIDEPSTKDIKGNPLLLELPAESVLVGHMPGNPGNHITYFVMVDEFGNPISAETSKSSTNLSSEQSQVHSNFTTMFGSTTNIEAFGTENNYMNTVNTIYENILDKYLAKQLKSIGMNNVDISHNSDLYRCMFKRLLQHKQTRMVIVPASLMTYLAFDYRDNGTGKSLIEDLRFVLTLHTTLVVSRIMSALDNSINTHKLSVSFDKENNHALKLAENIRSSYIESRLVNFDTHDPHQIARGIAKRHLIMDLNGIPGLEDFKIDKEITNNNTPQPDTDLQEKLEEKIVAGMVVPAAAMNNMGEDEYSRSVATTNIIFRTVISLYQRILTDHLRNMTVRYIKYSKPMQEAIKDIIQRESDNHNEEDEIKVVFKEMIDSLRANLPIPNLVRDKAQLEEFEQYTEMLEKVLNALYSDDLMSGDSDYDDVFKRVKAFNKANAIKRYMDISGFANNLDLADITDNNTINSNRVLLQTLANIKAAYDQHKTAITPPEGEGDTSSNNSNGW